MHKQKERDWSFLEELKGVERRTTAQLLEDLLTGNVDLKTALTRVQHSETGRLMAMNLGRVWVKLIDAAMDVVYREDAERAAEFGQALCDQGAAELLRVAELLKEYSQYQFAVQRAREAVELAGRTGDEVDTAALDSVRKVRGAKADELQRALCNVGQALAGKGRT